MKPNPFLDAARAEDLGDLLDHIAWTETIRPTLLKERDMFTKLLVSATLGVPVQTASATGPVTVTQEQLAGKIYGIDYIFDYFEKVLAKGGRAVEHLQKSGVHITTHQRDI